MSELSSSLSDKYFNQNLICFIIGVLCAAGADYCNLHCLMWVSVMLSILSFCSLCFTICFYTIEYCRRKYYKSKCYKLRYIYIQDVVKNAQMAQNACGHKIIRW